MNYIVPEYYKQFKCKCGDCRHSCCDGWPIRITPKEYYRLLGVNCSEKLRAKLDCALKWNHDRNHEASAQISTDWCGICMLHCEDGFCELQLELGESSLPEVCRLYPRNTKQISGNSECSYSNSCEEVVDLLLKQKESLKFIEMDLPNEPIFRINLSPEKYDISKKAILILQDRSKSLPERFITLGRYLELGNYILKRNECSYAFRLLNDINLFYKNNNTIYDYCFETNRFYGIGSEEMWSAEVYDTMHQRYLMALQHIDGILPDWQFLLEQLMVNHMFYNNFPYSEHIETVFDAYLALVITYSYLRFHILGTMYGKTDLNLLVDLIAAMFRLIEHSNFKNITTCLLKNSNYSIEDCIAQLLYL